MRREDMRFDSRYWDCLNDLPLGEIRSDRAEIYELQYEAENGDQIYCKEFSDELECLQEMQRLQIEFPEHRYWYEIIEDGR